jgi:hypothetical protein
MNSESRICKLEREGTGHKIRSLVIQPDNPDYDSRYNEAYQNARIAGDYFVLWDKDDDKL